MTLAVLTPREASIFCCLCDTVVAPEPLLPPVRETEAVEFFDRWLVRSPLPHRVGLRLLLHAAELAPRALGFRTRLRRLSNADRGRALAAAEGARSAEARQLVTLLKRIACLSYYGDEAVMRRLGYDAEANLRRARELRAREGRP